MSVRRACILSLALLLVLVLNAEPAGASITRELLTSFETVSTPYGLAVDLETGNVYVTNVPAQRIDVFGPDGGAPVNGVPAEITGLHAPGEAESDLPFGVAVDNSCYEHIPRLTGSACEEYDPAYGEVYAVSQGAKLGGIQRFELNSENRYVERDLTRTATDMQGVAIDSHGDIYSAPSLGNGRFPPVTELRKALEKHAVGGTEEVEEHFEELSFPQHTTREPGYVEVDGSGDIYLGSAKELGPPKEGYGGVTRLSVLGGAISEEVFAANVVGARRPIAVDDATDSVYISEGSEIAEYGTDGKLKLKFGSTEPRGGSLSPAGATILTPTAIAVNGPEERIYVANPAHRTIDVFGPIIGPPTIATQQPAISSVTRTSALIAGSVDPESGQGNTCYFEYVNGEEYEPTAADPYRLGGRTAVTALTGGHAVESTPVVALTGLLPGRTYHYRLVATNAGGATYGPDETFTTAAATPPVASTGPASAVTATGATLSGTIAAQGLATSYVFEVGTDTTYGGARLFGNAGAGGGVVTVTAGLEYLVPGVTYHYRLVASSFDGTSYGQDQVFTTPGVPSPIVQPASTPLLPSPSAQFPSIAGAITEPVGTAKAKRHKSAKRSRKRGQRRRLKHETKSKRGRRQMGATGKR